MLDLDNLFVAITATAASVEGVTDVYFDQAPEGATEPFVRYSVVGDRHRDGYGNVHLDAVQIQFSVFATDLKVANDTSKAINAAFHARTLTLTQQQSVGCMAVGQRRCRVSSVKPASTVYHASSVVEFTVQS